MKKSLVVLLVAAVIFVVNWASFALGDVFYYGNFTILV